MKEKSSNSIVPEIIDIHCHAAGAGACGSGCHLSPAMRKSWKYGLYLSAFGVTHAELEEHGDALIVRRLSEKLACSLHVDAAVVLALDCVIGDDAAPDLSQSELYVPNEFVAREAGKYANLYFGASINPYRKDAIERLDRAAEDKAVLLKWLPSIQQIDPADRRLIPFYVRLRETGLPLLTHTGNEHSFTAAARNELADPARLRLPLDLGVTVIAAHAAANGRNGGQSNFERILPMFAEYPNLYADVSSLTQINKTGHLRRLLRHEGIRKKLLYGTDMPILNTSAVSPFYFAFSLGIREAFSLRRLENPWDQDVRLKQALGVPRSIFERSGRVLAERMRNLKNVKNSVRMQEEGADD
ncbi:MAG: amidohydrolase [Nitrospirota bacterium]|nr:amidohydrolase [Nitrospirota bacterium]